MGLLNLARFFQILCVRACVFVCVCMRVCERQKRPHSPVGIAQRNRKEEGGRGKREWRGKGGKGGPTHPAASRPAPSMDLTVGRGSKQLAAGPCLTPYTVYTAPVPTRSAPGPTHLPNYEWVEPGRVRALCSPRHCWAQTIHPTHRGNVLWDGCNHYELLKPVIEL